METIPPERRGKRQQDRASKMNAILDATESIMIEEGYAAVGTRNVAKRVGLAAPLVHYYYKTTDDLLIAVYRRAAQKSLERHIAALESGDLLSSMIDSNSDAEHTVLALEFMAMANHRKFMRDEITASAKQVRLRQAEALVRVLPEDTDPAITPLALSLIVSALGRALVLESNIGLTLGHSEATEAMIKMVQIALTPPTTV